VPFTYATSYFESDGDSELAIFSFRVTLITGLLRLLHVSTFLLFLVP
jgi:hypothetical protein